MRPEDPVECVHCSAVILYVFFAILAKSQFSYPAITTSKPISFIPDFTGLCIKASSIQKLSLFYPPISASCGKNQYVVNYPINNIKLTIQSLFPPLRTEVTRETLLKIIEMQLDI